MINFKRAIRDIHQNRMLNTITVVTISFAVLIVSSFMLFFANADDILNSWKKGIRIIAYLKPDIPDPEITEIQEKILEMYGVQKVNYISSSQALETLKEQMKRQASLLDNLDTNPLPDSYEILMKPTFRRWDKVEDLAKQITLLDAVGDVEYGQGWLSRFSNIFDLFRVLGYAMVGIFFMAAVFIVANTARLVLYARKDEVDIMRLVGATNSFIKAPFYIGGLLQGVAGGILGLTALFCFYVIIATNISQGFAVGLIQIKFLSIQASGVVLIGSTFAGWLGCYISLRQLLK
ncbi:MAG: permease-like cell division protein FtsX [Desulfobacterales bacterium]|nr:permease-like cell division protein FtsX [Desulfobacterales bacterium]